MKLIEWPEKGRFVPVPDGWTIGHAPGKLMIEGALPDADYGNLTQRYGRVTFREDSLKMAWMCSRTVRGSYRGAKARSTTSQCRSNTVMLEILQGRL